jgi:hypothetical protein
MKTRIVISADEGKVLTDGTTYGRVIYLAEGIDIDSFHEITEKEYQKILKAQEEVRDE